MPKTATHAIRSALMTHLEKDDWQQQQLFGRTSLPIPELANIGHGHISVKQAQNHLPSAMWQDYYKFAFVRNPFDRFVSICTFLNRDNPQYQASASDWMTKALTRPQFLQRILVRPQSDLLSDAQAKLAMDYVGRYESLQQSFDIICDHIGIAPSILEQRNVSNHQHFEQYYDDDLINTVRQLYHRDFELFNY